MFSKDELIFFCIIISMPLALFGYIHYENKRYEEQIQAAALKFKTDCEQQGGYVGWKKVKRFHYKHNRYYWGSDKVCFIN